MSVDIDACNAYTHTMSTHTEQSRVTRIDDDRTGTVVALAPGLVMVMWDVNGDGTPNTNGRAYWHPADSIVAT